jgi:ribosomal protein L7/L12
VDAWVWIIVVVVVVVLLFLIFARRVAGGVDPTQLLLEPELVGRVRALAQDDQKIAAIKLLRKGTPGLGLDAAKQMVDKMAASPKSAAPAINLAEPVGTVAPDDAPSASTVPLEIELQARSLKSEGQAIQAIKLVRESTQWDLRSAKAYVDGL